MKIDALYCYSVNLILAHIGNRLLLVEGQQVNVQNIAYAGRGIQWRFEDDQDVIGCLGVAVRKREVKFLDDGAHTKIIILPNA